MSSEELPECLNNRNKALNELLQDALACVGSSSSGRPKSPTKNCGNSSCPNKPKPPTVDCPGSSCPSKPKPPTADLSCCKEPVTTPGEEKGCSDKTCPLRSPGGSSCKDDEMSTLMCDFWRILKDDPQFKLPQAVQSKQCVQNCTGSSCSGKDKKPKCPRTSSRDGFAGRVKHICVPPDRSSKKQDSCAARNKMPLRKALSNLKDAASFEKNCADRVTELVSTQQSLTEQIQNLEEKERKGVVLLKQADCMWSSMEEQYKKKLEERKDAYKNLLKEKRELDEEISKWRKSQKDLEFQIKNLDSNSHDIKVKTIQKENDIRVLEMEIENYKKRIANYAKDLEVAKKSYVTKKEASETRQAKINDDLQRFEKKIHNECNCKANKEKEGNGYVKEARDDLQKICRCLLQKKLENEDLRAEQEALLQEISLLKTTSDTCSDRCARREKNIVEETNRVDKEISENQAKCIQCHRQTDSEELTGYCIDCPRCVTKRNCLIKGEECFTDHSKDCVCTQVKEKFLDNVFENMYSVLEKKAKTCPGKEVADCIFTCLERSRNGKLDEKTRKILQEFVLSTVRKNLNLTIVGGAVKTRCEMDSDMYGQLMLCLKDVTVSKPVKADKGTGARKPPCSRWNDTKECNCPQGPKYCPCTKKAPKPPSEPGSCGQHDDEENEDPMPFPIRQPCEEATCPTCVFGTNMRAAQCVLGPEALVKMHSKCPTLAVVPSVTCTSMKGSRIRGNKSLKSCHTDENSLERSRHEMIEGVMGRYTELPLIEKVQVADHHSPALIPNTKLFGSAQLVAGHHHHCEMCAAKENYSGCDCVLFPTWNQKKGYQTLDCRCGERFN